MADQRWRGEKKQQMRKEPDPHQSLKWILKRTKVNRLFQLRRSDCFSVLEPSLISRASCCLKSQHCSRCLTWRVKNPASLYFFLPHRNAMNRFFFQLCSARCISRKQSENVRKTIGTPARCRLAAALKSTWNENDLVFFFLRNDRWFLGGRLVTSTSQQGKSPLAFVTGPASPPNRWRTRAFSISKCWNCCRTRRCLERRKATPLVTGGRGERRRKKKKWRTLSGFDARDPALLCHEMAVDTTPGNDVHFFIAVYVEDAESEVAIFGQEFPSNRTKNRFIKKKKRPAVDRGRAVVVVERILQKGVGSDDVVFHFQFGPPLDGGLFHVVFRRRFLFAEVVGFRHLSAHAKLKQSQCFPKGKKMTQQSSPSFTSYWINQFHDGRIYKKKRKDLVEIF